MNNKQPYRQGDVLLVPLEDSDFDSESQSFVQSQSSTLALGEATGHHHTFEGGDVVVLEEPSDNLAINERGMLVEVKKTSILRHQEHGAIEVPVGKYRRIISSEYKPEGIRNIMD